jgi:hypothetical protein
MERALLAAFQALERSSASDVPLSGRLRRIPMNASSAEVMFAERDDPKTLERVAELLSRFLDEESAIKKPRK